MINDDQLSQRWNISRSSCPELEARTSFSGVYEDFQCGLRVEGSRTRDSGIWGCEMVRGEGVQKSFEIAVLSQGFNADLQYLTVAVLMYKD